MRKSVAFLLFLAQFFVFQSIQARVDQDPNDSSGVWKAGVARAVITPNEYMWMAGYAARDKPADGMLHDLWAKALALEDAHGNRSLLITTDIIGFDRDLSLSICNRLENEYQLERRNIILSSSHTHSGPVINSNLYGIYPPFDEQQKKQLEQNQRFIEDQISLIAGRAFNSLAPARLSSGVGIARFAVNRRENNWNDELLFQPDIKGPSDHAVQVIKIDDAGGYPLAVLFGYSCHATCLSINKWSGDYPGFAQIELEKAYPGLTAMFFAGFGADQNPIPHGGIPQAEQYGKELAIAVKTVMKEPVKVLTSSIQTSYKEIELDLAPPPDNEELDNLIENGADWQKSWAKKIKEKIASGEELQSSYPYYPIQSWKLGEQTLVILGGEVVVDYVFKLRGIFGNDLMIMAYANDVLGYIPSERILEEGGYEGKTSMWVYGHRGTWVPGIEDKVVSEIVRQVKLLRNDELNK